MTVTSVTFLLQVLTLFLEACLASWNLDSMVIPSSDFPLLFVKKSLDDLTKPQASVES